MRKPRPSNKDIIDWKAFNYLVDKTTKYSDMGYHAHVCVKLKVSEYNVYQTIYYTNIMADGEVINANPEFTEVPMKPKNYNFYKEYGVFYSIWIQRAGGGWPNFSDEIYEAIKSKFDKVYVDHMHTLIVKVRE